VTVPVPFLTTLLLGFRTTRKRLASPGSWNGAYADPATLDVPLTAQPKPKVLVQPEPSGTGPEPPPPCAMRISMLCQPGARFRTPVVVGMFQLVSRSTWTLSIRIKTLSSMFSPKETTPSASKNWPE